MAKFYRKLQPQTAPVLSNGMTVRFETLDQTVGYYSTNSDFIISEFARFAQEQRYGIVEITFEEFQRDYLQKKSLSKPFVKPWREEIGSGLKTILLLEEQQRQTLQNAAAAVAVKGTDVPNNNLRATTVEELLPIRKPDVVETEFKPKVAKRKASAEKAKL